MRNIYLLICLLFAPFTVSAGERLEFSLHTLESGQPGPTVLVVGGIQGDEPGGFHAASLLVTNYNITRGNVWVVPNLNFESIVRRSRGVHGDMNRKFASVKTSDPDFQSVTRIKDLIVHPQVDIIFNLHDGSGFYREKYVDRLHNPHRWGQSIIIDEDKVEVKRFANIGDMSRSAIEKINQRLLKEEHRYSVKNTHTRKGNKEMEKTLTYFAINNGKSAIGIESSKTLPTHERAYYHLNALESFMADIGIEWQRDFDLDPKYVKNAINNNLQIAFYQNRLLLDISKARSNINYLPLRKNSELDFIASNPLLAITERGDSYRVNYGNRRITNLHPQYFEYDTSLEAVTIETKGMLKQVSLGNMVEVYNDFTIRPNPGYRFNVIGWTKKGVRSEAGHPIRKDKIAKRFSVDKEGNIYRVEVYKDKKFSGMVLVKFGESQVAEKLSAQASRTDGKSLF